MLRRLRLPGKLAIAALPLVVLLVAAATLFALEAFEDADQQDLTAELAATWEPLQDVIDVFAAEESATLAALDELVEQDLSAVRGAADLSATRETTDQALDSLRSYIRSLGDPTPIVSQFEVAELAVGAVRAFFDESGTSPATQRVRIPEGYDLADAQILEIGDFIVAEVSDVDLARELAGVAAVSRALQAATIQDRTVSLLASDARLATNLETIRRSGVDVTQWLSSFESTVTSDAALEGYRSSGLQQAVFDASRFAGEIVRNGERAPQAVDSNWVDASEARSAALLDFQRSQIENVVDQAQRAAADVRQQALIILGIVAAAVLGAAAVTALVSRSIVSRVRTITESARNVSQTQLPALVEALRDPSEDAVLPTIPPIRDRGADEVGDLARSFSAMQSTLEHVATQQVEVLRKGVADMFVTLARRNRSLIDRQLAMIDTLERNEEDPDTLADFYQLDHLATRMRRNAESLLVLAGTEPQKKWRTPLEVDDVVRAALGEVEDYRRIDVLALESVRLKGQAVADLAHLVSELLENATSFSPPETRVRIAGHFHDEGYLVTITDRGVGVPSRRLAELNELLARPPVVGLALEPTLGLYVVAMLSKRHGVRVRLVTGAPGLTAHVMIPKELFEIRVEQPMQPASSAPSPSEPQEETTPLRAPGPNGPRPPAPQPAPETVEVRSARHTAPSHHPAGLPQREAQTSSEETPTSAPAASSEVELSPAGLPTRKPGASFTAPEVTERAMETSSRDPEEIKSAFSSFQLGVTVGRDSNKEEVHHE
jgi:HAMP domain-containing protein